MAQFKVKGILSYPHLFQPRAITPGDDPKFSTSVLIRKDDPQLAAVTQVIEAEKANGFPSGFPSNGKCCLKDAAIAFPDKPNLHGYMVISGNSKQDQKPIVVDANRQPVVDPSDVYPGAVALVVFNSFAYNHPTSKGVSAGLNGVMLTGEEGELGRLDGRPTADMMFGDVPVTATPTSAPIPPPAAPAAPAALIMTEKANGVTYEQYMATQGWSDELLIEQGLAIRPSFG